jgi:hypothetical protein
MAERALRNQISEIATVLLACANDLLRDVVEGRIADPTEKAAVLHACAEAIRTANTAL